jgi:phage anti-repressor protein
MNTLPQIQLHQGVNTVSARELHTALEVQTAFTHWCKRMFEYGFTENQDYSPVKIGTRSVHNKTDYLLTLDTAKEIAMLQRTPVGKQVRNYFIEKEKGFNLLTETITNAQRKALEGQKEKFGLLQELEKIKQEYAQVFKRIAAIKKRLKANQTETFIQLGFEFEAPKTIN